MRYAHSIKIKVFSHEDENDEKIQKAFKELFPLDLNENKIEIKKTQATGFNEKKIKIYEIGIIKESHIRQFLSNLLAKLGNERKKILIEQKESRLDEDLDFFIRLHKDKWIEDRKMMLTDTGKCFHIKMSIAAFPRKREIALKIIDEMLG